MFLRCLTQLRRLLVLLLELPLVARWVPLLLRVQCPPRCPFLVRSLKWDRLRLVVPIVVLLLVASPLLLRLTFLVYLSLW